MAYAQHPLLRQSLRLLKWHKLLPTTRWGDRQYARLLCLMYNGHLPRSTAGGYADFIAYLKGSQEIETPERRQLSDKELLKAVVMERLGPAYFVPTFAVLRSDREINQFTFPERCVIKPTHSSGQIIYLEPGQTPNQSTLRNWLRFSHYRRGRERNYRGLQPKIIVEEWLDLDQGWEVKIHCVRGEPRDVLMLQRTAADQAHRLVYFLDTGGVLCDIQGSEAAIAARQNPVGKPFAHLPPNFGQVLEVARVMAQNLLYARIDLYWTVRGIWVGEVTTSAVNGLNLLSTEVEQRRVHRLFGPRGFCLEDFPELR